MSPGFGCPGTTSRPSRPLPPRFQSPGRPESARAVAVAPPPQASHPPFHPPIRFQPRPDSVLRHVHGIAVICTSADPQRTCLELTLSTASRSFLQARPPKGHQAPGLASNFPSVGFLHIELRTVHQLHVSHLSVQPISGGPIRRVIGFPLPFGCRPSLHEASLIRWGFQPSLRSAYWTSLARFRPHRNGTPPGRGAPLPRFARERLDRGGCPLYAGAKGAQPWGP